MKTLNYLAMFAFGFLSCMLLLYWQTGSEIPRALGLQQSVSAPGDWIKESAIHVYENAICIDVENASMSSYAATGSMRPTLDSGSNGIRIVPKSASEINVGDIVSFEDQGSLVVHRVVEKGTDSQGDYFVTKGDNNSVNDGKIRFSQIKYVTIGVIF